MGEIADGLITEGMVMWQLHLAGECDTLDKCQYCESENESN